MEPRDLERIIKWLDESVEVDEIGTMVPTTRLERLAELTFVNGSHLDVGSWGVIVYGGAPYGREGLTQAEGFELMRYGGIIGGLEVLAPGASGEIARRCKEVWSRRVAEFEAVTKAEAGEIHP